MTKHSQSLTKEFVNPQQQCRLTAGAGLGAGSRHTLSVYASVSTQMYETWAGSFGYLRAIVLVEFSYHTSSITTPSQPLPRAQTTSRFCPVKDIE